MDAAGYEFFARAAFTRDEHGRIARGDLTDRLQDFLHRFRTAHDAFFVVGWVDERFDGFTSVGLVAPCRQGFVHEVDQLSLIERLHDVIVGTKFHGLDGGLGRAKSRHQYHHRLGLGAAEHLQSFDTGHTAHAVIEQNNVGLFTLSEAHAAFAAIGLEDGVTQARECPSKGVAQVLIVIDDDDFGGSCGWILVHMSKSRQNSCQRAGQHQFE